MWIDSALRRIGQASPLVPAVGYTGILFLTNLIPALVPGSAAVALAAQGIWIAAAVLVFVVVAWYRDDDWLAAGFLLGMTMLISAWVIFVVWRTLITGAFVDALVFSVTAPMTLLLRGIIVVPLWGGAVALARWIGRRLGGRSAGRHKPASASSRSSLLR